MSLDQAWTTVLGTLTANAIPVASSSREAHQIVTAYIPGGQRQVAGGFLGTQAVRYKFMISFTPQDGGKMVVMVNPIVEMSHMAGGLADASSTPFLDVSAESPQAVNKLRSWLYQQIEAAL